MDAQQQALIQQIQNDPRVTQLADQRKTGGLAGTLNAADLRALGYNVPDTWTYIGSGTNYKGFRGQGAGVRTDDGFFGGLGRALPYIGAGFLGAGTGLALAGGGAAASQAPAALSAAPDLGGLLPSTAIPGASSAVPGAIASQGASAAAGGGGLAHTLRGLLSDPNNLTGLAGAVTALVGGSGGGTSSAEAQRLNQITEERMRRVDPLHQAITQLAWSRLPTTSRQGITPPTYSPLK